MSNITIDINIPFYLYNCDIRKKVTFIILKNYERIVNLLEKKYKVSFSFTFIGSEGNISKNFIKNNFKKKYTYYEFEQVTSNFGYNDKFLDMLTDKFRKSFDESIKKKPNITLLAGSNDFISMNFFKQIIKYYKSDKKQLYGISNKYNGNNVCVLDCYSSKRFLFKKHYHTGVWNDNYIKNNVQFIGGIIGFNDKLYNFHKEELLNKIITYNECAIETEILKLNDIDLFRSRKCFFVNIKTASNKEITKINTLLSKKDQLINERNLDRTLRLFIKFEYRNFILNLKLVYK